MRTGKFRLTTALYLPIGEAPGSGGPYQLPMSVLDLMPDGSKSPKSAFTGFYGLSSVRTFIQHNMAWLNEQGYTFVDVNVYVDIGSFRPAGEPLETIEEADSINLCNTRVGVVNYVNERWQKLLVKHKIPADLRDDEKFFPKEPTRFPHLIGELRKDPRLMGIKTWIFPYRQGKANIMLASYFEPERLTNDDIECHTETVVLPE